MKMAHVPVNQVTTVLILALFVSHVTTKCLNAYNVQNQMQIPVIQQLFAHNVQWVILLNYQIYVHYAQINL